MTFVARLKLQIFKLKLQLDSTLNNITRKIKCPSSTRLMKLSMGGVSYTLIQSIVTKKGQAKREPAKRASACVCSDWTIERMGFTLLFRDFGSVSAEMLWRSEKFAQNSEISTSNSQQSKLLV